ncbi:MAG: hypothetical protein AB7D06_08080 [Pedobacter sp.]
MEYSALLLESEGRKGEELLINALKQAGVLSDCYAYKTRVKTEEKLIEKVSIKKQEGKIDYDILNVTDVIGLRLITLFRVDMVNIFEKLLNIVLRNNSLDPNPFKKDGLEELIFYSNRFNDKIGLMLRDVSVNLEVDGIYNVVQRGSEYSSIHIVARLNKKINKLSSQEKTYYLPVEIQIRTVFEDAWGEVDHKYGYSFNKGKNSDLKIRNPNSILRHLDILKKFSDACGEYADAIHLEILDDNCEEVGHLKLKSVGSDQKTIDLFIQHNIDQGDIDTYVEARSLREEGLSLSTDRNNEKIDKLSVSGKLFKDLYLKYADDKYEDKKLFYYYSSMNYAFCLLSTNLKKEAEDALILYEQIEKIFPDFLLVKMRLAQAYGQNWLVDLSLKKCNEAYSIYKEIEEKGFEDSVEIPESDYKHIKKYLPKVYGYYLWHKSELVKLDCVKNAIKKVNMLKKAYYLTLECLENDDGNYNLYNNLLYYALDMIKVKSMYSAIKIKKDIVDSIEKNLNNLSESFDIDSSEDIDTLDTLAKAYDYLGRCEERNRILDRLIPLAENSLQQGLCDNEIIETIIREGNEMRA